MAWRPKAGSTLAVAGAHGRVRLGARARRSIRGGSSVATRVVRRGIPSRDEPHGGAPEWRPTHLKDDADASRASRTDVDPYASPAVTGVGRVVSAIAGRVAAGRLRAERGLRESCSGHFKRTKGEGVLCRRAPARLRVLVPVRQAARGGVRGRRAVAVWEVGTGARTSIASGAAGTSKLLWSPCGRYLFRRAPGGRVHAVGDGGMDRREVGDGKRRGERGGVGTRTAAG